MKPNTNIMTNNITNNDFSFLEFKKMASTVDFPNEFAKYISSFGERYFWQKGNFHVFTKAKEAKTILTSSDFSADRGSFFISRMPDMDLNLIVDFFGIVKKMMVMSDDQDHLQKRKLASLGFEDHILERFTIMIRATVKNILKICKDKTNGNAQLEFVESVAKILPSTVLADLFSIPEVDRENFYEWSNTMTGFFGGASTYFNADGIKVNQAAKSLKSFFEKLIKERRGKNGHDYISILLESQNDFQFDDENLIAQLIMMLVAGQVTTTDQINNCLYQFATNLDLQIELKKHPELIPSAIEECKRFDPAVSFLFRVARNDCEIEGHVIKNGDVIFISNHCINRDLPDTEDPNSLNIHRKSVANHFAYGHGPHYCLGAKLGRLEMKILFEELIRDFPLFTLDDKRDSIRDHYSLSFSGFKKIYLNIL